MDDTSGTASTDGGLQFDKVELATPAAARACGRCGRAIDDQYFAIANMVV